MVAGLALLTALFLTPLFFNLPEAVLGAIVLYAILGFFRLGALRRIAGLRRDSFAFALFTLFAVLFLGVLPGLVLAVLLSLALLLGRVARPGVAVLGRAPPAAPAPAPVSSRRSTATSRRTRSSALLGAVMWLTAFVPLFGSWLGAIPALLVALSVSPVAVVLTGVLYLGINLLDGNVLTPRLQGSALSAAPGGGAHLRHHRGPALRLGRGAGDDAHPRGGDRPDRLLPRPPAGAPPRPAVRHRQPPRRPSAPAVRPLPRSRARGSVAPAQSVGTPASSHPAAIQRYVCAAASRASKSGRCCTWTLSS